MLERRRFLVGLLAAPAIVRASSIMPVRVLPLDWVALAPPGMKTRFGAPMFELQYMAALDPATGLLTFAGKRVICPPMINAFTFVQEQRREQQCSAVSEGCAQV